MSDNAGPSDSSSNQPDANQAQEMPGPSRKRKATSRIPLPVRQKLPRKAKDNINYYEGPTLPIETTSSAGDGNSSAATSRPAAGSSSHTGERAERRLTLNFVSIGRSGESSAAGGSGSGGHNITITISDDETADTPDVTTPILPSTPRAEFERRVEAYLTRNRLGRDLQRAIGTATADSSNRSQRAVSMTDHPASRIFNEVVQVRMSRLENGAGSAQNWPDDIMAAVVNNDPDERVSENGRARIDRRLARLNEERTPGTPHPDTGRLHRPGAPLASSTPSRPRTEAALGPAVPPHAPPAAILFMQAVLDDAPVTVGYLMEIMERLGEVGVAVGASQSVIDRLPTRAFEPIDAKQKSCVICMCDYEGGHEVRDLPCEHNFHVQCIDTWLKQRGSCPICRNDIRGAGPSLAPV